MAKEETLRSTHENHLIQITWQRKEKQIMLISEKSENMTIPRELSITLVVNVGLKWVKKKS